MRLISTLLICCAVLVTGEDTTTTVAPAPDTPTTTTTVAPPPAPPAPPTPEPPKPPTTTTTEKPTTSVPPTPIPSAEYPNNGHKWTVEGKDNVSCIALKGAIQFEVKDQNRTTTLSVPVTAIASGSCDSSQSITLSWNSSVLQNETIYEQNTLTFTFDSNSSKALGAGISAGKYGVQNVTVQIYLDGPGKPVNQQITDKGAFQTPFNHSYSCLAEEVLKSEDSNFTLKIRDMQLEAYRKTAPGHKEFKFSSPVDCPADDATDVVPIAVGAALAGLVVIVLVAYLIGRKRSRARGYQSV